MMGVDYCLHLMHLRRGELRDADHWAHLAADLEFEYADDLWSQDPQRSAERPAGPSPASCGFAGRVGTRAKAVLREAVATLTMRPDEDFGAVPQPDPPSLVPHLTAFAAAL